MGPVSSVRCETRVELTCENIRTDAQVPLPSSHPMSPMIPVGCTTSHALFNKTYRTKSLLLTPLSWFKNCRHSLTIGNGSVHFRLGHK